MSTASRSTAAPILAHRQAFVMVAQANADRYGTDVKRLRCNASNHQEQLNKNETRSNSYEASARLADPGIRRVKRGCCFLPLLISQNTDVLYLFLILPVLALTSISILIYAALSRNLRLALIVATFCAVSALVFLYSFQISTFTRWGLWSGHYKKEVLVEPTPVNGDLKHIEWAGWGFAGMDSTVFLVFDPTNSLAEAAQKDQFGKLKGIPCEVDWVRRMDSHWYIVLTDTYSWDCTDAPGPKSE